MWEVQRSNRRNSVFLVLILGSLMILAGVGIGMASSPTEMGALVGGGIAMGLWSFMSVVTYFQGDRVMLGFSGAKEARRNEHPQLYNVVEEMSIASGLPMPRIYIISDTAPNAFATGRNEKTASIAVTRGLLMKLNRNELQAVIAHEMAHIKNRDVLYMIMTGIMLGVIVLLCDFFLHSSRHMGHRRRSSNNKSAGGAQIVMVILMILFAILAPILARVLFFAVSRKREYLADACAAEMTRYPDALADALEKISGDHEVLEVANRATAALYICNPIKKFESRSKSIMSTHPPIQERVKILRAMGRGGDASFLAYNNMYKKLSSYKAKTIVPDSVVERSQQKLPILNSTEDLTSPPRSQEQQLERLRDIQNLVVGVMSAGQILCVCGFAFNIKQFQSIKTIHEETTGDTPGVVNCKSCGKAVADPADAKTIEKEQEYVQIDLLKSNKAETKMHTRTLEMYKDRATRITRK